MQQFKYHRTIIIVDTILIIVFNVLFCPTRNIITLRLFVLGTITDSLSTGSSTFPTTILLTKQLLLVNQHVGSSTRLDRKIDLT